MNGTKVRLLLMDCDGVLTDGRLYFSKDGEVMKAFHVRDGQGIVTWHETGFQSGIISGRDSKGIIQARARELRIKHVRVGSSDKVKDLESIVAESNVGLDEVAFIGDDIGDIPVMKLVGFPVAVADAMDEVKAVAKHVTNKRGGRGAVREVIDMLLSSKA